MFFKIIVLKKFTNLTGKHMCRSLPSELQLKKRLQHKFFPAKFAKLLRTHCFTEHLQWRFLTASDFQPAALLKKRLRQRCLSVNFAKFERIFSDRTLMFICEF